MEAFLLLLLLIGLPVAGYFIFRVVRNTGNIWVTVREYIVLLQFLVCMLVFWVALGSNDKDFSQPIDPVDDGYTPFASKHVVTLASFFLISICSMLALWIRGRKLPPLTLVLAMVFLLIGMPISVAVLLQVSHQTENIGDTGFLFSLLPLSYLLTSSILLLKLVLEEADTAQERIYSNKILQTLNGWVANARLQPLWVLLLLVPAFLLVVALLTLFGQDTHAITKVFTDTATWRFSQQAHPPFLDHRGHYLCTVAACGNPEVVKPLAVGRRHGHPIIINRQLQIANAFEELVQDASPALHRLIRNAYDRYGYPLSRKINTPQHSNLVYRLMKPLEYAFLSALYLCCLKPEEKIARQYSITSQPPRNLELAILDSF